MELNGVAHVQLTVGDFERAVPFYEKLLHFLGMKTLMKGDGFFYCVGGRTGIAITPADPEHRGERFEQRRVGLHHICLRARSREHIDELHEFLKELGAEIVRPPEQQDLYAPGYYSLLFEDPDGIRIEVNFVPGKGHFEKGVPPPAAGA